MPGTHRHETDGGLRFVWSAQSAAAAGEGFADRQKGEELNEPGSVGFRQGYPPQAGGQAVVRGPVGRRRSQRNSRWPTFSSAVSGVGSREPCGTSTGQVAESARSMTGKAGISTVEAERESPTRLRTLVDLSEWWSRAMNSARRPRNPGQVSGGEKLQRCVLIRTDAANTTWSGFPGWQEVLVLI
jgi:hypothetical protein